MRTQDIAGVLVRLCQLSQPLEDSVEMMHSEGSPVRSWDGYLYLNKAYTAVNT
jgi:hypothetical protein